MAAQPHQPRPFQNNGYLPNGVPDNSFAPGPHSAPFTNNQARVIQTGASRILCVADVRGELRSLNDLARKAKADFIIHTGDFGFYDNRSLERIAEKTLKHVAQYSPLLSEDVRRSILSSGPGFSIKDRYVREQLPLSELPYFLNGSYTLDVPVYTVWGACEDVAVLERFRNGEYKINNLFIIDEAHSKLLEVGGLKLRLLGLGGAVVMHKLFDNGEGKFTIAGGQGTMWTTLLQIGELVDTASRCHDPSETRILITHASPAREALLNQLAVSLKVDFSISAGLHFRYGSSYNEFSVNPTLDHYRGKLAASKASFADVWETVKNVVMPQVSDTEVHQRLLNFALDVVSKMPSTANGSNPFGGHGPINNGAVDEMAFKNMWNFNLADAAFGYLVLEIEGGRIGTEMRAQGFNFAHRSQKTSHPTLQADMIKPSLPSPPASIMSQSQPPYAHQGVGQLPQQTQQRPVGPPITPGPIPQQGFQQARPPQPQAPVGRAPQPQQAPIQAQQTQQFQPAPAKTPTTTARPAAPVPSPAPSPAAAAPAPPTATPAATAPPATNGTAAHTAPSEPKSDATPAPVVGTDAAPKEQKPSTSIFISGVTSEEAAKALFSEEDRAKITRVQKRGISGNTWLAWFNTPEEMQAVLAAASPELKEGYKRGQPQIKEGNVPERGEYKPRGTGTWGQRSTSHTTGTAGAPEGGEAGRGRGGFRARGGSMRGGRGGRGRGGQGNGDAATSSAPSAPAAASTS